MLEHMVNLKSGPTRKVFQFFKKEVTGFLS